MKKQGSGYVLNVSSYFGGEKYLAVAYPNRGDYAVSKAGQRAHGGNAWHASSARRCRSTRSRRARWTATGCKGLGGRPGLFERRGRLILENRRLNAVHAAVVKALRRGVRVEALLARLAANDVAAPGDGLRRRRANCASWPCAATRSAPTTAPGATYLMTRRHRRPAGRRLRLGGCFLDCREWQHAAPATAGWRACRPTTGRSCRRARSQAEADEGAKRRAVAAAPGQDADRDRGRAGDGVLPGRPRRQRRDLHALGRPEPGAVDHRARTVRQRQARAARHDARAHRLADRRASGASTWRRRCGSWSPSARSGKVVAADAHVPKAPTAMRSRAARRAARPAAHRQAAATTSKARMDAALQQAGTPTTVVATPFEPLPRARCSGAAPTREVLRPHVRQAFRELVEVNLTHHVPCRPQGQPDRRHAAGAGARRMCRPAPTSAASASRWPTSSRPRCTPSPPRWRSRTSGW